MSVAFLAPQQDLIGHILNISVADMNVRRVDTLSLADCAGAIAMLTSQGWPTVALTAPPRPDAQIQAPGNGAAAMKVAEETVALSFGVAPETAAMALGLATLDKAFGTAKDHISGSAETSWLKPFHSSACYILVGNILDQAFGAGPQLDQEPERRGRTYAPNELALLIKRASETPYTAEIYVTLINALSQCKRAVPDTIDVALADIPAALGVVSRWSASIEPLTLSAILQCGLRPLVSSEGQLGVSLPRPMIKGQFQPFMPSNRSWLQNGRVKSPQINKLIAQKSPLVSLPQLSRAGLDQGTKTLLSSRNGSYSLNSALERLQSSDQSRQYVSSQPQGDIIIRRATGHNKGFAGIAWAQANRSLGTLAAAYLDGEPVWAKTDGREALDQWIDAPERLGAVATLVRPTRSLIGKELSDEAELLADCLAELYSADVELSAAYDRGYDLDVLLSNWVPTQTDEHTIDRLLGQGATTRAFVEALSIARATNVMNEAPIVSASGNVTIDDTLFVSQSPTGPRAPILTQYIRDARMNGCTRIVWTALKRLGNGSIMLSFRALEMRHPRLADLFFGIDEDEG